MCYKISNTANRQLLEDTFNAFFTFPKLYRKMPVIDGLAESTVPVICLEEKQEISFAIWGLLPDSYQDDWQYFQDIHNTLNLNKETICEDEKYRSALNNKRCVVLVTGFFTYYLHNGQLFPYYVHLKSKAPFAIAGIYNELDDGFKTCSLVVSKANAFIQKINNSHTFMPVVLDYEHYKKWLNPETTENELNTIIDTEAQLNLIAHPIAKEFHKLGVDYDSVLEPVIYNNLPKTM